MLRVVATNTRVCHGAMTGNYPCHPTRVSFDKPRYPGYKWFYLQSTGYTPATSVYRREAETTLKTRASTCVHRSGELMFGHHFQAASYNQGLRVILIDSQ